MLVVTNGDVREHSTAAARTYVEVVRDRLRMEVARHGESTLSTRSCQELQRSISPEQLRRMWPHADIDAVLGRATPATSAPD